MRVIMVSPKGGVGRGPRSGRSGAKGVACEQRSDIVILDGTR